VCKLSRENPSTEDKRPSTLLLRHDLSRPDDG
jgi:hypothetical protein